MKIKHPTTDTQGGWTFKCGTGMEISDAKIASPKMLPDSAAKSGDVGGYPGGAGYSKSNKSTVG